MLQINDDEVELWVVKAITSKLIDCKMDQMNEVVIVRFVLHAIHIAALHIFARHGLFRSNIITLLMFMCSRCTDRVFGQHQWETLRTKLATWRVNYLFCFS